MTPIVEHDRLPERQPRQPARWNKAVGPPEVLADRHEGIVIPKADAMLSEIDDDAPFQVTCGAGPQQNVCYKDTTGRFFSGTWASEDFESKQRPFPYNAFACVQDGSITLTEAELAAQVFNAGDAFFIPQGVECDATVANSVRLYIAVVKSD